MIALDFVNKIRSTLGLKNLPTLLKGRRDNVTADPIARTIRHGRKDLRAFNLTDQIEVYYKGDCILSTYSPLGKWTEKFDEGHYPELVL